MFPKQKPAREPHLGVNNLDTEFPLNGKTVLIYTKFSTPAWDESQHAILIGFRILH